MMIWSDLIYYCYDYYDYYDYYYYRYCYVGAMYISYSCLGRLAGWQAG
jgi:hypothetical protein